MTDLVNWLREQLDDDERIAKRVEPNQAPIQLRAMVTRDGSPPFLIIDSARALAEVDAKRRRLDLIVELAPHHPDVALRLAKLDALPYADCPGYREDWRP